MGEVYIYIYYPVDISTTVFSYSRAVQYHTILHGCYCTGPGATRYPSNWELERVYVWKMAAP